ERPRLLSLPEHPFASHVVRGVRSGKTPYVRFDLNDYSIPSTLVRRPLTLIASESLVRIVDVDTEIARHARSYDRGRKVADRAHLEQLADDKRRASELRGRDRLTSMCSRADALLEQVALRGGHLGGTTTRLLHLLDREGAPALDAAIGEA